MENYLYILASKYQDIYTAVHCIPEGQVATYGQIARLAGRPNGARQVGYALAGAGEEEQLPWHRVINAKGEISARAHPDFEGYQRMLLEEEGIEFSLSGRVNLNKYQWLEGIT